MKTISKPAKQLFLFSNNLDPRIETWFDGSIIIEQKFPQGKEPSKELGLITDIVSEMIYPEFKYITNVINHKPDNLLFLKISNSYPLVCSLTSESDYIFLGKIHKVITAWLEKTMGLGEFMDYQHSFINQLELNFPSNIDIHNKERDAMDLLLENDDNMREFLLKQFYERLTI